MLTPHLLNDYLFFIVKNEKNVRGEKTEESKDRKYFRNKDPLRSEMRYLVWITESHVPSSLWKQVAPEAIWPKTRLPGCHASRWKEKNFEERFPSFLLQSNCTGLFLHRILDYMWTSMVMNSICWLDQSRKTTTTQQVRFNFVVFYLYSIYNMIMNLDQLFLYVIFSAYIKWIQEFL